MLKAIVKDINTVDEAHRPFYVEKDGMFVLNVTPTDGYSLENVEGLKTALSKERREKGELQDQFKAFEGLDATAARKAIKDAEKWSQFDPEKEADRLAQEKLNNAKAQLQKQHEDAVKPLNGKIESLTTQLKQLLVDNAITSELGKLNPLDDARDAVELLAARAVRVKEVNGQYAVEVVDDQGNPRIKDALGNPMGISDYLAELREKRPSLFKPDDRRGIGTQNSGSPGAAINGGKNPWAKDGFNITEQMKISRANPTLAARLKSDAGVV